MSDASPPQPRLAIRTFLLQGAVIIGIATILERGFQFVANFTSARIAGEENLGAYSLALQAAGSLASQASLGIGMVATRFSAEYPRWPPAQPGVHSAHPATLFRTSSLLLHSDAGDCLATGKLVLR